VGASLSTPEPSPIAVELDRLRAGDLAAADPVARRACTLALRTAAAILHSREAASDIAQDVAVEVLRSIRMLRDPGAFDAWVHRITVRHVLRALKRRRRAGTTETPLALLTEAEHPAAEEADQDMLLAARQVLALALAELPAKQRLALALRYVHDLSDAEIAAALDCRPGSVHALLSRGRAALRRDGRLAELALAITGG
jgi:RNA polymerase sigma factor (sigma-70 family)